MTTNKLLGLLAAAGFILIVIVLFVWGGKLRVVCLGKKATAEVVSFQKIKEGSEIVSYPVVQFRAASGATIKARMRGRDALKQYYTGQKVVIYYDPSWPEFIAVVSSGGVGIPITLIIVGVIAMATPIVVARIQDKD